MGFFDKFKKKKSYEGYEEEYDEETDGEEEGADVSLGGANIELKVIKPSSFEQILTAADYLIAGRTVLLNLEGTEKALCRRMIDFIGGVAYSLDANIKKATNDSYLIAPPDVDVSGEIFESKAEDDSFSDL